VRVVVTLEHVYQVPELATSSICIVLEPVGSLSTTSVTLSTIVGLAFRLKVMPVTSNPLTAVEPSPALGADAENVTVLAKA
jgi:hypothetical protein